MEKLYRWVDNWLPGVWAALAIFTITGVLIGTSIWVVQWVLSLLGVL